MAKARRREASDADQGGLFKIDELPEDNALVRQVEAWSAHTGTTAIKDMERAEGIATALMEGLSIRKTCRRYGVSHNTVRRIVSILERMGKLDTLKQRLIAKAGYAIELGVETIIEKMEADELPPAVLPVAVGVLSDKKDGWEGNAPPAAEVHVHLSQESLLARFAALKPAATRVEIGAPERTIDVQSSGEVEKAQ